MPYMLWSETLLATLRLHILTILCDWIFLMINPPFVVFLGSNEALPLKANNKSPFCCFDYIVVVFF